MSDYVDFYYAFSELKVTELTGVKLNEYYEDLTLMVESQNRAIDIVNKEIGETRGLSLDIGHVASAGVMGCKLIYPEYSEPWAMPFLNNIVDVERLEVPEPKHNPYVQEVLGKAKKFKVLTGIKPNVGFEGPVTTAALCRGVQNFFVDVYRSPRYCKELMCAITDTIIEWKRYHESEMNIEPESSVNLADDSSSFLSPRDYRELALTNQMKWYEAFHDRRKRGLHNCGDTTRLLEIIDELGLTSFEMGEKTDLIKAKSVLRKTKINQLFDLRILLTGSLDDIMSHTRNLITLGSQGNNFGIGIEGWKGISFEKVRLIKGLVRKHNEGKAS